MCDSVCVCVCMFVCMCVCVGVCLCVVFALKIFQILNTTLYI